MKTEDPASQKPGTGTALATGALCAIAFVPSVTQWVSVAGCALGLKRMLSDSSPHEALSAAPSATPQVKDRGKEGNIGK